MGIFLLKCAQFLEAGKEDTEAMLGSTVIIVILIIIGYM